MNKLICLILIFLIFACGGGGGSAFNAPTLPQKSDESSVSISGSNSIFVGYDDTGSTALVQLMKYQITNNLIVDPELVQPYSLLNAEEFISDEMETFGAFKISIGLLNSESKEGGKTLYDLGVHLSGPELTTKSRKNMVLTICLDVSGSMNDYIDTTEIATKAKIDLIKEGLISVTKLLKYGDVVNFVLFSDKASILTENFIVGDSSKNELIGKIMAIKSSNSSNLEAGLKKSYELANKYFENEKKNRVLLITDGFANVGNTQASLIANNTIVENNEGVLLSAIGVGYDYDATFLEELTEAGGGNQFLLASDDDSVQIFSRKFLPLLMLAAKNLKVEIIYPDTISHIASAAEQTANSAEELKGINFSYNISQFYLERFKADADLDITQSQITLKITYNDPRLGVEKSAFKSFLIGNILNKESSNIKDALTMVFLTSLVKGKKTWEDIQWELDHVLDDHSSTLFTEYKSLLYDYANMPVEDEDSF